MSPGAMTTFPLLEQFKFSSGPYFRDAVAEYLHLVLRRCDNLKELHVEGTLEPLVALVKYFDSAGEKEQPMCPRLTHLHLQGTSMAQLQTLLFRDRSSWNGWTEQAASYRPLVTKSVYYNGIEL